jgi:hypothetical protein
MMADIGWVPMNTSLNRLIRGRGSYRVADVLGAGGALALGAVLEGFQLAAKREDPRAVGIGLTTANRALLGDRWSAQATTPDKWRLVTADAVVSAARTEDDIGILLRYAAKLKPGVLILDTIPDVFQAQAVCADLISRTLLTYRHTTIRYNDLSLGGVLDRRRDLTVLSQVPIGVDRMALDWLPTADDAVMDMLELGPDWEPQRLHRSPTWYSRPLRAPDHTVDGFMTAADYRAPLEWDWKRPGQLLNADGLFPVKGRDGHALTHREIARMMGFPDAWLLGTTPRGLGGRFLGAYWEIGASVHAARWIMRWVRRSLDGNPGPLQESRMDLSEDWKPVAQFQWSV